MKLKTEEFFPKYNVKLDTPLPVKFFIFFSEEDGCSLNLGCDKFVFGFRGLGADNDNWVNITLYKTDGCIPSDYFYRNGGYTYCLDEHLDYEYKIKIEEAFKYRGRDVRSFVEKFNSLDLTIKEFRFSGLAKDAQERDTEGYRQVAHVEAVAILNNGYLLDFVMGLNDCYLLNDSDITLEVLTR